MSDRSVAISSLSFPPAAASGPTPNRTVAARTRLLLEGPVLSALLRLSAQISTDGQIGDCNEKQRNHRLCTRPRTVQRSLLKNPSQF
jgi:hypothetical protein